MTADPLTYTPNPMRILAERAAHDWPVFMYDGLGIMPTTEQIEARELLGRPGPRDRAAGDPKTMYLSGAQRAGKTVLDFAFHAEANLYKCGLDNSDRRFWDNYLYKTLAVAPTVQLTLRLWQVGDEISKGASEAQFDRKTRTARGGKFLRLFEAGKAGDYPVIRFNNNSRIDFQSTEGYAFRLEGDQWWFSTWDEWASQPDREIEYVLTDVLMGRLRDHDGKIVPSAWPKSQTEHHLIAAIRKIDQGLDLDSKVAYMSAEKAFFSNRSSLKAERLRKNDAQWTRTVLGRPYGGSSIEFPKDVTENMVKPELTYPALPEQGYRYFVSWDLGMSHDSTCGLTWRIPLDDVTPANKVRIVDANEIKGGESVTIDSIAFAVAKEQLIYSAQSAVDATGFGGTASFRQMRDLRPPPLSFKSRSNDRIHGNMRLAAITNGLDLLTWGRPGDEGPADDVPWGLVECPRIVPLLDQLANFDRDAKEAADDWVWSFLIGLWYIKRFYVLARDSHQLMDFNLLRGSRAKRVMIDMRGNVVNASDA